MNTTILSIILSAAYYLVIYFCIRGYHKRRQMFTKYEYFTIIYYTVLLITIPISYCIYKSKVGFSRRHNLDPASFGYDISEQGKSNPAFVLVTLVLTTIVPLIMAYHAGRMVSEINMLELTKRSGATGVGKVVDFEKHSHSDGNTVCSVVVIRNSGVDEKFTDSVCSSENEMTLGQDIRFRISPHGRRYYIEPLNKYRKTYSLILIPLFIFSNGFAFSAFFNIYLGWVKQLKATKLLTSALISEG